MHGATIENLGGRGKVTFAKAKHASRKFALIGSIKNVIDFKQNCMSLIILSVRMPCNQIINPYLGMGVYQIWE